MSIYKNSVQDAKYGHTYILRLNYSDASLIIFIVSIIQKYKTIVKFIIDMTIITCLN